MQAVLFTRSFLNVFLMRAKSSRRKVSVSNPRQLAALNERAGLEDKRGFA
jgi:hypothetical protein